MITVKTWQRLDNPTAPASLAAEVAWSPDDHDHSGHDDKVVVLVVPPCITQSPSSAEIGVECGQSH